MLYGSRRVCADAAKRLLLRDVHVRIGAGSGLCGIQRLGQGVVSEIAAGGTGRDSKWGCPRACIPWLPFLFRGMLARGQCKPCWSTEGLHEEETDGIEPSRRSASAGPQHPWGTWGRSNAPCGGIGPVAAGGGDPVRPHSPGARGAFLRQRPRSRLRAGTRAGRRLCAPGSRVCTVSHD